MTDTLQIICPHCESFIEVTTYDGSNDGNVYCPETAPLEIISEVNAESKKGRVRCASCGLSIALVVRFIAFARPLDEQKRYNKKWREE